MDRFHTTASSASRPVDSSAPSDEVVDERLTLEDGDGTLRLDEEQKEHFIPVRKEDLIQFLLADMDGDQKPAFKELCKLLEATFHFEYHDDLEALKNAYAPFNPDADTHLAQDYTDEQKDKLLAQLFERFDKLLLCANYHQLDRAHIEAAVDGASDWGIRLRVDFDSFERLEVYARGDVIGQRTRRRWRNWLREEEVDVEVYRKLAVIFRLAENSSRDEAVDPDMVFLKMFKNIPKQDVDMLLPCSRVQMTWMDRGRILLPTLSGIALTVVKLVKVALFASVLGVMAMLGLVAGTIGYGVKSFFGYLRTKDKYQLNLTRSLYYQNLDNNAGVLFRILDEAEEQEFREAILGYFLLLRTYPDARSAGEVDRDAEDWLEQRTGLHVDFEVEDSLAKLERLGLVESAGGDRWRAVSLAQANRALDKAWDQYFHHD